MSITDILYIHHLQSRGICGKSEDDMKSYLMKEGHSSTDTLSMIKRYNKVKGDLFEYSWKTHEDLLFHTYLIFVFESNLF